MVISAFRDDIISYVTSTIISICVAASSSHSGSRFYECGLLSLSRHVTNMNQHKGQYLDWLAINKETDIITKLCQLLKSAKTLTISAKT